LGVIFLLLDFARFDEDKTSFSAILLEEVGHVTQA
jgi:hypothetical protein